MSSSEWSVAPPVGEKPEVLRTQASEVEPGDEVIFTEGAEHVAVRAVQVEVDDDNDAVLLVPRGREERLLSSAHPVIVVRGTPSM
jgi:hypothetical protein